MTPEEWANLEPGTIIEELFNGSKWRVIAKEPAPKGSKRIHYKMRQISPRFRSAGEPMGYKLFVDETQEAC
jgi:hypothetical protein